jgi:SAM-dependent methyltransferase
LPPSLLERGLPGLRPPNIFADQLYTTETLSAAGPPRERAEPFSLQWYLDVEGTRYGRQGRWIPRLLEFGKHKGERLLGLGSGVGTDWVQFARGGAEVIACSPGAEHAHLVQRNFELRGLRGVFLHADPAALPLDLGSIDVVYLNGLLSEVADTAAVVEEVYRVLKPGGKVIAVAPACYDLDFWQQRFLPWSRWSWTWKGASASRAGGFSARALRRTFARFVESRVYKRHLRRRDVPHLWRWLPHALLERLLGRMLIFKAFKPLSAAIPLPLAA